MTRTYLVRGMLVGLLASLAAFAFAQVFGEPQIRKAIELEERAAAAAHTDEPAHADGEEGPVSRDTQETIGLGTGLVVVGAALGGLFGLVFAFAHRRLTRRPARVTAVSLAAAAFVALYVVPWLKYPPNPPAVGDPETIGRRTGLFLLLVVMTVLATVLANVVRERLRPRLGGWNAGVVAIATFVVVVAVLYLAMPGTNEVSDAFPPMLLWRFRLASLGTGLVLWTVIGLGFGALTERAERRVAAPVARAVRA
jgi:predicted cobalt transporter CbtA